MLRNVTLNKKGSLFDFIQIIPIIFVALVIIVTTIFMFQTLNSSGAFAATPEAQQIIDNFQDDAIPTFDFITLAALVGMFLGSIILAFAQQTNPALFWINILLLGVLVIFSVALSNAYEAIEGITALAGATAQLSVSSYVFSKLPIISTIYGIVMIVVMLGVKKVGLGEEVDFV